MSDHDESSETTGSSGRTTDPVGGDDVVGDAGLDDPNDTEDALEDLDDQDEIADLDAVEDSFGEGPE